MMIAFLLLIYTPMGEKRSAMGHFAHWLVIEIVGVKTIHRNKNGRSKSCNHSSLR